jgi:hypothetical protein
MSQDGAWGTQSAERPVRLAFFPSGPVGGADSAKCGSWRRRATAQSRARGRLRTPFAGAEVRQGNAHRVSDASDGYLACIPRAQGFSRETPAIAWIGRRARRIKASRRCGARREEGVPDRRDNKPGRSTSYPGPDVPGRLLIRRVRARLRLLSRASLLVRAVVV